MKKAISLTMALAMIFTTLIVAVPLATSAKETVITWMDFDHTNYTFYGDGSPTQQVQPNSYIYFPAGSAGYGMWIDSQNSDSGNSLFLLPWVGSYIPGGPSCIVAIESQSGNRDVSGSEYLDFWVDYKQGGSPNWHINVAFELSDGVNTAVLKPNSNVTYYPASGGQSTITVASDNTTRLDGSFRGRLRIKLSDFNTTLDYSNLKSFNVRVYNSEMWFQDGQLRIDSINFIKNISLNYSSLSMLKRETKQLTATNATITSWSSSNEAIATVDSNGLVTSKSAYGSTTITATTSEGDTLTCAVTVAETVKDTWLDFDNGAVASNYYQVLSGDFAGLNLTSSPADGGNSFAFAPWSPEGGGNGSICSISLKSQYGVTDVSSDTYLEFWCKFNMGWSADHLDTLLKLADGSSTAALNSTATVTYIPSSGTTYTDSLKDGNIRIPNGYVGKIRVNISDFASTVDLTNLKSITLTSDNRWQWFQDSSFYIDSINFVRAKPVITNLALDRSVLSLIKNDSKRLNANDDIESWSSSDETVATVDASGVVTSKGIYGDTIITATSYDGYTATCSVTVGQAAKDTFIDFDNGLVLTSEYATVTSGDFAGFGLTEAFADSGKALNLSPWSPQGGGNGAICSAVIKSQYGFDVSGNEYLEFWCKYAKGWSADHLDALITLSDSSTTTTLNSTATITYIPVSGDAYAGDIIDGNVRIPDGYTGKIRINLSDFTPTVDFKNLKAVGISADNRWQWFQDSTLYVDSVNFTRTNFEVTGVTLTPETTTLIKDQTLALSTAFSPFDAENKALTWTSDNEDAATVTADGVVTAIGNGIAVISATSVNGIIGECTITVADPVDFGSNAVSGSMITLLPDVTVNGFKASITANGNTEIKYYDLQNNEITDGNLGSGATITVKNPNTNETTTYSVVVMGDLTGDGAVDTLDLVAMKNHLLKKKLLTGNCLLAANQSGNQEVGIVDILILKDTILKKKSLS